MAHGKSPAAKAEKAPIPKALREQVWITYAGRRFERMCLVPWCRNVITVFDFHVGHNVPESVGGATNISNLRPICSRCNLSMGSQYSITEWSALSEPRRTCWDFLRGKK
jgi:5-methylcytosine-specific restriction endonuclease McrA